MRFKIIQIYERYDGANIIDKLNNTELSLKLFHIQGKEFGNNKCYGETTQLEKWQSEISPDIRKEMEDSRLNATDRTTDSVRKGPGKRGHIVANTLLPMMFLGLRKLGNICCGHKMFLNKIRNIFCVPDTKFVSATNVALADKRGNICVGNNVSATMCPRLPGP